MNVRQALAGLLLTAVGGSAWGCDLPRLVAIPPAADVGDDSGRLIAEMQSYVTGIRAYTACTQADLVAAGGDAAPDSFRNALIRRNNAAVAEARTVIALFGERVAPVEQLYLAEFLSGGGQQCIDQLRLEKTGVVDDRAVLFIDRSGRSYLNVLERNCPDLARFGHFDIRSLVVDVSRADITPLRTQRLCSDDFILPYAFELEPLRNRECALGQFFEITEEQTGRLMALRSAMQQPASPDAPPEETPTPPSTAR
jgi:hypothetical protein